MGFPPPHDAATSVALLRRSSIACWLPHAWGFAVGVVFAGVVLGWDVVAGDPPVVRQVAGDNAAGLAAFRAFIADGWHWPLLAAPAFGDSGVNVAFSDSIPLLAVIAKLARPAGVGAEAWWGGWFAFAYGLHGAAAVFAVRSWGGRSGLPQLVAPVLAVSMPVLLLQTVHPSLSAHGVLLLAWGVAGRARHRLGAARSSLGWMLGLTLVAVAIHPYLGVMVAVMAAGVAGDGLVTRRLQIAGTVRWFAAAAVALGSWLVAGGYLGGAGASEGGYGRYATSVLGPVVPTLSSVLDGEPTGFEIEPSHPGYAYLGLGLIGLTVAAVGVQRRRLVTVLRQHQLVAVAVGAMACWAVTPWVRLATGPSVDLPTMLAARLGSPRRAGIAVSLVGVVLAVALLARLLRPFTPARSGGWGAAKSESPSARTGLGDALVRPNDAAGRAGLAAFLPARAAIGALVLGVSVLGLVAPRVIGVLMSQFRASGRFAWPLLYGLLVMAVAAVDREQLRRALPHRSSPVRASAWRSPVGAIVSPGVLSAVFLTAAAGVQIVDTATLRTFARELLVPGGAQRQDYLAALTNLVEAHDRVVLGPDFRCTYYPDGVGAFIDVTGAASAAERPIDRVYAARRPQTEPCSVAQAVDLSDPGALIVLVEPVSVRTEANRGQRIDQRCRQHATLNVCSHRWEELPPRVLTFFEPVDD